MESINPPWIFAGGQGGSVSEYAVGQDDEVQVPGQESTQCDQAQITLHKGIVHGHKVPSALDVPSSLIGDGGQVSEVVLRKGSRCLETHRELAQCSFNTFALFVPASSFMRRQAHVDTLGISALLRFNNFL